MALVGSAGCEVMLVFGGVLSTVTVIALETVTLPAAIGGHDAQVVVPVGESVVSQLAGVAVQVPAPAGERSKTTDARPEPLSAELLASRIVAGRASRSPARSSSRSGW